MNFGFDFTLVTGPNPGPGEISIGDRSLSDLDVFSSFLFKHVDLLQTYFDTRDRLACTGTVLSPDDPFDGKWRFQYAPRIIPPKYPGTVEEFVAGMLGIMRWYNACAPIELPEQFDSGEALTLFYAKYLLQEIRKAPGFQGIYEPGVSFNKTWVTTNEWVEFGGRNIIGLPPLVRLIQAKRRLQVEVREDAGVPAQEIFDAAWSKFVEETGNFSPEDFNSALKNLKDQWFANHWYLRSPRFQDTEGWVDVITDEAPREGDRIVVRESTEESD